MTRQVPQSSMAARALTSFNSRSRQSASGFVTPTNSQPSSPMRKDPSPFSFPPTDGKHCSAFGNPKRENLTSQKVQRMLQDRNQQVSENNFLFSFLIDTFKVPDFEKRISNLPSSPLRIIPPGNNGSIPGSPVLPIQRNESPVSQEDEEVLAIVGQGHPHRSSNLRQCDSVLHDPDVGRGNYGSKCLIGAYIKFN